jgi:hypothetical protein
MPTVHEKPHIRIRRVEVTTNLPGDTDRIRLVTTLTGSLPGESNLVLEFQALKHNGLDYVRQHIAPLMDDPHLELVDAAIGERRPVRP